MVLVNLQMVHPLIRRLVQKPIPEVRLAGRLKYFAKLGKINTGPSNFECGQSFQNSISVRTTSITATSPDRFRLKESHTHTKGSDKKSLHSRK